MNKRRGFGMLGAGFAMAVAALMGSAQATQPVAQATQQQATGNSQEIRGVERAVTRKRQNIAINNTGGLDFPPMLLSGLGGLSPREYGLRYGNGASRKHKSNKLRYMHNAKLKLRCTK